jgi:microcystin-dependent protein
VKSAPASSPGRRDFLARLAAGVTGVAWLGRARAVEAAPLGTTDQQYLGEIRIFGGFFAPQGWAFCNGQLLPIAQNQALFAILGTTYGGNGQTTFALPDLRGRAPIHFGQGPGLANRALGEGGGEVAHTLTTSELPAHTHTARGGSAFGSSPSPAGLAPARVSGQTPQYAPTADSDMNASAVTAVGGGQAHENRQPYLGLTYIIALIGIFPQP